MKTNHYKLVFLPLFEQDLNEIIEYITNTLNQPIAANRLVNDIEQAILKRRKSPLAFAPYPSTKKRKFPYYRINVHNFAIFYVVIDDTMEIRRILYAKRNIAALL